MASLMTELRETIENSSALQPFKEQLVLDITEEGLRIQVVDKENRPMFDSGSARLKYYTRDILHELAKVIQKAPNKVSLTGHTDAVPFLDHSRKEPYTNWELSADRSNASRRELVAGGLAEGKVAKVVGLASIVPFDKGNPFSPRNRRISIIIMNKAAEAALLGGGGKTGSDEKAQEVLEQEEPDLSQKDIVGSSNEPQTTEEKPARQKTPAPVVEKKTVAKKPQSKKSQAVELGPPADENTESVIPLINPIELPKIPGS